MHIIAFFFFFTEVVEHWLEHEIAQWIPCEELIQQSIAPQSYVLLPNINLLYHRYKNKIMNKYAYNTFNDL